jgi:DNA-binding transcriptional MerR regulator
MNKAEAGEELLGINELAMTLGVTHRTLRFYEAKGLIEPRRIGQSRIYTKREAARMRLILRGKQLGFTVREIKDFLDLYQADPQHITQQQALLSAVRQRLGLLEQQQTAINQTLHELRAVEQATLAKLAQLDASA